MSKQAGSLFTLIFIFIGIFTFFNSQNSISNAPRSSGVMYLSNPNYGDFQITNERGKYIAFAYDLTADRSNQKREWFFKNRAFRKVQNISAKILEQNKNRYFLQINAEVLANSDCIPDRDYHCYLANNKASSKKPLQLGFVSKEGKGERIEFVPLIFFAELEMLNYEPLSEIEIKIEGTSQIIPLKTNNNSTFHPK